MRASLLLAMLLCSLLGMFCAPASGQTTDTLQKLRKTKVLSVGVRDGSLPFSTIAPGGASASGYSVDLCNKIADAIRKELKLNDLTVSYVLVNTVDRIPKLKNGQIDIECGNTVNTRSRQTEVDFSYSIFYAGQHLMVRSNSGIDGLNGLVGKTVGVVKGTTAEKMFSQIRDSNQIRDMKLVILDSNPEAFKALEAGKINAFAQLNILMEALRVESRTPSAYAITTAPLSVEPLALMVRKNDPAFRTLVDNTLAGLYASGEINAIYDRWFNSGNMRFPMTRLLRDGILHPNHESGVALGLGYQL